MIGFITYYDIVFQAIERFLYEDIYMWELLNSLSFFQISMPVTKMHVEKTILHKAYFSPHPKDQVNMQNFFYFYVYLVRLILK